MSLKKIGSRDSTAFELSPRSGTDSKILGDSHVPWMTLSETYIYLWLGRYRIDRTEAGKIEVLSMSTWEEIGTYDTSIVYLEAHSSDNAVYFSGGGTVFITRLA